MTKLAKCLGGASLVGVAHGGLLPGDTRPSESGAMTDSVAFASLLDVAIHAGAPTELAGATVRETPADFGAFLADEDTDVAAVPPTDLRSLGRANRTMDA